jgi:hypothetical protein
MRLVKQAPIILALCLAVLPADSPAAGEAPPGEAAVHGLDLAAIDRGVDPCVDFYRIEAIDSTRALAAEIARLRASGVDLNVTGPTSVTIPLARP